MPSSITHPTRPPARRPTDFFRPRVLRDLAIYLACMLPVVWGLVAVEQSRFASLAENSTRRDLRNYARVFTEEVRATVGIVDLSLLQLRSTWLRDRDNFSQAVGEHARHLRHRVPMVVTVIDPAGRLTYTNAGPSHTGRDLSAYAAYYAHLFREHARVVAQVAPGTVLGEGGET
jgi:hypothetical protein